MYSPCLEVRDLCGVEEMKHEGDTPIDDDREGEREVLVGYEGEEGRTSGVVERGMKGGWGDEREDGGVVGWWRCKEWRKHRV